MRAISYIGAEKITFPPKPDIQIDRHTYRRTDISVYRVASLLKIHRIRHNHIAKFADKPGVKFTYPNSIKSIVLFCGNSIL